MKSCLQGSIENVYDEATEHVPAEESVEEKEMILSLPSPELEAGSDHPSLMEEKNQDDSASPCTLDWRGKCEDPGGNSLCRHSSYGKPNSSKVLKQIMSSGNKYKDAGLVWRANIVPDNYDAAFERNGTLKMLAVNSYDSKNTCIKPRRGDLSVKSSDFFSSLVKLSSADDDSDDEEDIELYGKDRWIFSGVLNGWPGLQTLEVEKIQYKGSLTMRTWRTHWDSNENPRNKRPTFPNGTGLTEVRVKLRAPPHTSRGWLKSSPGYLFWFEGNGTGEPDRLLVGESMIQQFERDRVKNGKNGSLAPSPKCIKVHMISHRYATGHREVVKDRFTYHSLALLEWDHGKFCTVVELAYLGGLGGYQARCNWLEDKNETPNSLYKQMISEMIHPWINSLSEIRMINVRAKSVEEHLGFMKKHLGQHERFLDIHHTFTHDVRLSFSSKEHIVRYLINYIERGKTYSEIRRNCQTFAADFCAFLAGKRDVQPFHPINRLDYRNNTHYFMYDSSMYEKRG